MRYEVRMGGYNLEGKFTIYPPFLETNDLGKAFAYMAEIKKHEEDAPYYSYEEARIFDSGKCIVEMHLH